MAKHWKLSIDNNKIAWLGFDRADQAVNTLNEEALNELKDYLAELAGQRTLQGIVFFSLKKTGFIAGADIKVLSEIDDLAGVEAFIRLGQEVFSAIEAMPQTTVAMIEGFCMGGGLELALACNYRIAVESDKRSIALPEVKLGIFPGWGGSVRLPRLIGVLPAINTILTGRALTPKAAAKMGIIDHAVPRRHLLRAVLYYLEEAPSRSPLSLWQRLLTSAPLRPVVAKVLRYKTRQLVKQQHYTAPFTVIDNWERMGAKGEKAYEVEAQKVSELAKGETASNLLRVFHLQDQLKRSAKKSDQPFRRVHVIGSGIMGGDIAAWCAMQGLIVTLQDANREAIGRAIQRASELYNKKLKTPRLVQAVLDRLIPDPEGDGIKRADVVIEAIFENVSAKQKLFASIETQVRNDTLLATNTSSIQLRDIASAMQNPRRLVGIHFFNPVSQMPLVEVVHDDTTDPAILIYAKTFVKSIDKLPLAVTSQPGFLVNRILMAYLMEAVLMVEEAIPLAAIDKAATDFGMPMGPIELADTVGLDICLSVAENLQSFYGGTIPAILQEKIKQQQLGRKSGQGFYQYRKGNIKKPKIPHNFKDFETLQQRLVLRYLNEAMACLHESVVSHADNIDAGMIFGTGFAPFRGGPLHYAASIGLAALQQQFDALANRYGDRFAMHVGWSANTHSLQ